MRQRRARTAAGALKTGLVVGALAAALTAPSAAAHACGATPPAFWVLTGAVPGDAATALPIDGALRFDGRAITPAFPDDRDGAELAGLLQVRVRAVESALEIPGEVAAWTRGAQPSAVWRPHAKLAPGTTYEVYARLENTVPTPPEAAALARDAHFTFRTAEREAPPLRLAGMVGLEQESYVAPAASECLGPCGNREPSCVPTKFFRGSRLRVTVPPLDGGWPVGGMRVDTRLHANGRFAVEPGPSPAAFFLPGAGGSLTFILPDLDVAERVCVPITVVDARGVALPLPPTCLDLKPHTTAEVRNDEPGGCALAPAARRGSSWPLGLLVAAAGLLALRRRRA